VVSIGLGAVRRKRLVEVHVESRWTRGIAAARRGSAGRRGSP